MDATSSALFTQFYQTIINQQRDFYTAIITGLGVFSGLLLGATWIWNFILAKRQIKSEVSSNFNDALEGHKEMISKIIDEKSEKMTSSMENKILRLDANISRSLGIQANKDDVLSSSLSWWTRALADFIELKDGGMIRICVDFILKLVKMEGFKKQLLSDTDFNKDKCIQSFNKIPDTLNYEKLQLIKIIEKIKIEKKIIKKN